MGRIFIFNEKHISSRKVFPKMHQMEFELVLW